MSITVQDLSFSYFEDGKNTLDHVSCAFDKNKITVLTGRSGCGKSTFLFTVAGIYPKNAGFLRGGDILIEGQKMADLSAPEKAKLAAMMFQNPDLQFCMDTPFHELVFCLENLRTEPEEIKERAEAALEFCGISNLRDRKFVTLSGGEKQKVMLACVTAIDPAWLLLDEPFANIDVDSAAEIIQKLVRLHRERGTGILAVDHRLDNWTGAADIICFMENGGIQESVAMDDPDVYRQMEAHGAEVPGKSYLSGKSFPHEEGQKDEAPSNPGPTGQESEPSSKSYPDESTAGFFEPSTEHVPTAVAFGSPTEHVPTAGTSGFTKWVPAGGTSSPTEPVLTMEDLSLVYPPSGSTPARVILSHASMKFYQDRIYALTGKSGAGKSSFFGTMTGMNRYDGVIRLEGTDIRKFRRRDAGKIGFVTQNPQDQFIGGTVREEIMAALRKKPDAEETTEQILRKIKLWRYRDISPYMLSQGQQRRLGVAALLTYPCRVLLCDEPTYAQDRENTIALMDSLCAQVRKLGIVMIFSTHDHQLAKDYADCILTLEGGKIIETDKSLL